MKYEIDLLPEDFKGNVYTEEDCPFRRALRRHFNTDNIDTPGLGVFWMNNDLYVYNWFTDWDYEICNRVRECYTDPKHDTIYYVEVEGPTI